MKYLLLCLSILVLYSCRKYDQGGNSRQFRKKISGDFSIEYYQLWGKDSTYWAKTVSGNLVSIRFYEDENRRAEEYYVKEGIDGAFFITGKREILYSYSASSNYNNSIFLGQTHWSIIRLTEDEFWLRTENEYVLLKLRKK